MLALFAALLLAAVPANPAGPADPAVTVKAPLEYEVLQRADAGPTPVKVHVVAPSTIGRLVAIARPSGGGAELARADLATTTAPKQGATADFTAVLELPPGGWYGLAITVDGIAGPVEVGGVKHFGVGEVFVVAGQSNSTNSGEERLGALDARAVAFDGQAWTRAADPMPGVQDGSTGGSPWPACGKALVEAWGVPVALASVGYGGTSMAQWQKNAAPLEGQRKNLYAGLLERAQALGRFRAILWHQGESDAGGGTSSADYVARFRALRDALEKDLGRATPWVVANVSFVPDLPQAPMDAIRAAQAQLWKDRIALQGPDTDDMRGALRHSVDKIHFSKAGLEAHGKRWAERLGVLFPKR
jgi:hypothetical protein